MIPFRRRNLVLPLLLAALFQPGKARGNSNHLVSWQTYETVHFKIVFHADVKTQADTAAVFLEQAYARIAKDMGMRESKVRITVVLTGLPDDYNGSATPLGHNIVIFTRPAQVPVTGEIAWLKRVLAHELAHQITFLALRKPFLGIYSELYKVGNLPAWFLEGLAQYQAETWDAKRNAFFAHALYNSALEPYPNLAAYTKEDPLSGRLVYEQGHAFVRFLMHGRDERFLRRLLRRITVVPLWTEIKQLLSPLTGSILPLESALRAETGKGIKTLYSEFLESMRAGLPGAAAAPARPMLGGAAGFAFIYQIKAVDSASFLFTGQREWDEPHVSLFLSRNGKAVKIGPDFVNPVFDASPDGNRVLYVRAYRNPSGDPVEKLFLLDRRSGSSLFISDGATHPIFLGPDSLAFSRYRRGRQALVLCALASGAPACAEAAPDSLPGMYGLSRSAAGILLNATDARGRTGVYEFRPGAGFQRIVQDTVTTEFPVEAPDGAIWMLRERDGLLQVDAFDRGSGEFTPVTAYPLGTFYLHRAGAGRIASMARTGGPGRWSLMPVEAAAKAARPDPGASGDTAAAEAGPDPIPRYRAPAFLASRPPVFPPVDASARPVAARAYNSLAAIRPLLALPVFAGDYPSPSIGAGLLLQDPLSLHSLSLGAAPVSDGIAYDLDYTNRESRVETRLRISNFGEDHVSWLPQENWNELDMVARRGEYSLALRVPPSWDVPVPHSLSLGLKAYLRSSEYRLAGSREKGEIVKYLDSWSLRRTEFIPQIYLTYGYRPPYSYAHVHPLSLAEYEAGYARGYPGNGGVFFWHARQTSPLWKELTVTARYGGNVTRVESERRIVELPDGELLAFFPGMNRGSSQDIYASVDFPLYKGYLAELPLFGPWNYLGASFYGGYFREDLDDKPGYPGSAIFQEEGSAGVKLNLLFHPTRRIPLALSPAVQYDWIREAAEYRVRIELSGLPDSYSLFPGRRNPLGGPRSRMP